MIHSVLADFVLVLHGLFVLFVVFGGLLALRWVRAAWIHVPCALWGAWVELAGWVCPLTPLEVELRMRAGEAGYTGGFIERYVTSAMYPQGLTREIQIALGLGVLALNMVVYGVAMRRSSGMSPVRLLYRAATGAARALSPLFGRGDSKLAAGVRGRRDAHETLSEWGRRSRDASRPTVWFHAPSVGEGLQARAVIEALRARRPDAQVAFTHFSPSAAALARRIPADVATYLPWDLPGVVRDAWDPLGADALVFTKTEVWPELAERAVRGGKPVCLIAGTLPEDAGRLRGPARAVLRSTWERMALVAAVGDADARRFESLGVPRDRIEVTGDPGIDSAASRVAAVDPGASHLRALAGVDRPTLVAGSTWPSDEKVLLPALEAVRREIPGLRVVVAPHEPTAEAVASLRDGLRAFGMNVETLSVLEGPGAAKAARRDAIIVDRVGVLAELYTAGRVAYVGGGFHDAGLHSVLEPAAAGVPALFGPRHGNAPAAARLLEAGAAHVASDAEGLARALGKWLVDDGARDYAGQRAIGYIDGHRGAAERTAELLDGLLPA